MAVFSQVIKHGSNSVDTTIKWNAIFKRWMTLMDTPGESYFSGSRFIRAMQVFNDDLPNYTEYIEGRQRTGKSTTRSYFFKEILMDLDESVRARAVSTILNDLQSVDGNAVQVSEIRRRLAEVRLRRQPASLRRRGTRNDRMVI